MSRTSLSLPHFLLALAVMAVWGSNFVVMRFGLQDLPPLLLAALRFIIAFLPAALFLPRPRSVPLRKLAAYGILVGALQFGLLLTALKAGLAPGLASVVVQAQVFFTIGLAIALGGERMRPHQWLAVGLALGGLVLIALRGGGEATPLGMGLALLSALCWAVGNMVARTAPGENMLAYVVWSSLFAAVPLSLGSWLFEGPAAIAAALAAAGPLTWASIVWQSFVNTLFGFAVYGWLLSRYPAASVAPLTLLVPVFGLTTAALVVGEALPGWKLAAAAMVVGGLVLNQFWPAGRQRLTPAVATRP